MLELLVSPEAWIAFVTLTALELVLGIDNVVFISILVDRLPAARRDFARRIGLFLAMFMRIGLLLVLSWLVGLTAPLFTVFGQQISGRDVILIAGKGHEDYQEIAGVRHPYADVVEAEAALRLRSTA